MSLPHRDEAAQDIGLIGVGLLGIAIAERIQSAGHNVLGFDVDPARLALLNGLGGQAVSSLEPLASLRRIFLSLPNSTIVTKVIDQIQPLLTAGQIIIDTTTGDPRTTEQIGKRLSDIGVHYLDATVAGSSQQLRERQVTIMVGGDLSAFDSCRELLGAFSSRLFHVGPSGSGARMKLVVNMAIGLHRAVLAESLAYAEACGLNSEAALHVLRAAPSHSQMMDTKGEKMLNSQFEPQARLAQHLKDVDLMLNTGKQANAHLPLTELHQQLLKQLVAEGHGELDNSAIIKAYRREE